MDEHITMLKAIKRNQRDGLEEYRSWMGWWELKHSGNRVKKKTQINVEMAFECTGGAGQGKKFFLKKKSTKVTQFKK